MDSFDQVIPLYIAESREHLENMEQLLLGLNLVDAEDSELLTDLNGIFRAAHTIKGSAGMFGFDHVVSFTHNVETLLDDLRSGITKPTSQMVSLLLDCADHIGILMDYLEQKLETPDDINTHAHALISRLQAISNSTTASAESDTIQKDSSIAENAIAQEQRQQVQSDSWHISLRFDIDSFRIGMDPLSFFHYLETLGDILHIQVIDAIPDGHVMDPESCYLGFEINFKSDASKQTIEDVFEFVREDSNVHIFPPNSFIDDYILLIQNLPEEDFKIGEILVQCGSLTRSELENALTQQQSLAAEGSSTPLGNIIVEQGLTDSNVLDTAVKKQAAIRQGKNRESQSIRVDADKLDELINLVGELVIAGAGTELKARATHDIAIIESVTTLSGLVEEVRDSALRLRMVQISATFNRFQRVVHDICNDTGKEINLVITGAETELDKTVVEKIGDPLMHLVRNALDHGIEMPSDREAKGKPATGILALNAYHDSGSIVIEVKDDGSGLNKEQILRKAIEKGMVTEGQSMDDAAIYNLIFEPGFSTAASVTNLSGRGVGMDVVRRNITDLRGSIELESHPGEGTIFRVRMPLTLAIIDGFLVKVETASFIVSLDSVLECIEMKQSCGPSQDSINLRGEVLPIIRLRQLFSLGGDPPARENIVVVHCAGHKVGLLVDNLMGEFQTVIKPLGSLFSCIKGISGSTILGDGEVALILDVADLIKIKL